MARVLVADDDDAIRELATLSLERVGGHEVRAVGSGRECVETARAWRPDAVLLDVMMPDVDGPTTLRELQADPATGDLPVVFLTAKVRSTERTELAGLGAAGVLGKPFDPMTLSAELGALLGWPAQDPS